MPITLDVVTDESSAPVSEQSSVPWTLRTAGVLVALEGLAGVVVAVVLVIRGLSGHHEDYISNYGTAAWFLFSGGAVLAGGRALLRGRRWGRGVAVFAQLMLLVVAWTLITGSHLPLIGVPVLLLVLAILVLLFAPTTTNWFEVHDLPPDA